eukprot:SAG22_NODE_5972_length_923_cov_2.134709_1_plen_130_part_00
MAGPLRSSILAFRSVSSDSPFDPGVRRALREVVDTRADVLAAAGLSSAAAVAGWPCSPELTADRAGAALFGCAQLLGGSINLLRLIVRARPVRRCQPRGERTPRFLSRGGAHHLFDSGVFNPKLQWLFE